MSLYNDLCNKKEKLALVGLGYVGLPIAVEFAKYISVVGFDTNSGKIAKYKEGIDVTCEVGDAALKDTSIDFTSDENDIKKAKFIIVAVPTPIMDNKTPDLEPLVKASEIVGRNMQPGSIVVYESTVYPGVTEDICAPILEKFSNLKCGVDFKIGYSPERTNPGDKEHRLSNIVKIVSGMDEETLDEVANVYSIVVKAGVHRADSIKVAEAAKVVENCQRDINIAFMNELSIIFNKLGIDTKSVLEAAGTKWNFLKFAPGLVGGHCIGVDPYYLTYKASEIGYHSQVILSGRRINDDMGRYVAENTVKKLVQNKVNLGEAKVAVLGYTFKENCPDMRNTKVQDIIDELDEYGVKTVIYDPVAEEDNGVKYEDLKNSDAVIAAVAHEEFKKLTLDDIAKLYKPELENKILIDIKGMYNRKTAEEKNYIYWRL